MASRRSSSADGKVSSTATSCTKRSSIPSRSVRKWSESRFDLKSEIIEALGLSVTDAAEVLGVTRPALSALLNQRAPLSPVMALRIAAKLRLVQGLRDVRDQIGRVFDADRQPDRGVENAYFLANVGRNPGVGHACGQAGK